MTRRDTIKRRQAVLRAARRVIRQRYPEPELGLADVAEAVGVSPRQLQRIFREQAGEDFRTHLLRVRMERARRLLSRRRNPLPTTVVAPRVGYSGPSGLRQAFRRLYGVSPSVIQPPPRGYIGTFDEPES